MSTHRKFALLSLCLVTRAAKTDNVVPELIELDFEYSGPTLAGNSLQNKNNGVSHGAGGGVRILPQVEISPVSFPLFSL